MVLGGILQFERKNNDKRKDVYNTLKSRLRKCPESFMNKIDNTNWLI